MIDPELERRRLRASLAGRAAVVFTVVVVLSLIAAGAALLLNIRDQARTNAELAEAARTQAVSAKRQAERTSRVAHNIRRVADQLADCIVVTGKCFKEQSARTGEAVGQINVIAYYAAACADRTGTQSATEIRVCVTRLVEHTANSGRE